MYTFGLRFAKKGFSEIQILSLKHKLAPGQCRLRLYGRGGTRGMKIFWKRFEYFVAED
jgi:hypothetical protein